MIEISRKIIDSLPYGSGFCFVNNIDFVDENQIIGNYLYSENLFFYKSHFATLPIVPGVIILETMGQIGLVCHQIYLLNYSLSDFLPLISNMEAEFYNVLKYSERIHVIGRKIYFRNNILKSYVEMRKEDNTLIATLNANISLKNRHDE